MKCPKCQTVNPDDSKYCKECAAPLTKIKDISFTVTLKAPKAGFSKGTVIANKYKIIEEIGRGGMGVVYKAEDLKLKRTVALKFLPPELIQDQEAKQRFIQEAQAAAALNHPHICTIHEVDESDDQMFISMEYIEGQTLKDKLASGPINIDEATVIATQVAQGLDKAHKKGIIHRDIKPANIMINDDGQAKITDFGLAKLSRGVDLTKTSTFMGTVAYMSPEQAKGEAVDHRTDIWSLGAMMYEMLAGERPFTKSSEHALIYSILNEEPQDLFTLRPDLPVHIQNAVQKALAKDADYRYADIQSLIQDLEPPLSIYLPKTSCSIVVLPFDDMSPNRDNEYFSDGLTEEIITDLSQVHELCVISRNSAMALKGTKKNTKTIGKELNVQYVLEGSVRKAGDNLRITSQLIDATTDIHLWADKYKGKLDDIFDIQEKVSRSIVDALKLKLSPKEDKKIAERPIRDAHAYDLYLRARKEILSATEEGLERAHQLISHGLTIIGDNELIFGAMGYAYFQSYNLGFKKEKSTLQKGKECAEKVFSLNPDSYIGHFLRAVIHWKTGDIQAAIREHRKTLELNPNHLDSLVHLGYFYTISGKPTAAKPWLVRLKEIAPLDWLAVWTAGEAECEVGNFGKSLEYLATSAGLDPENPFCQIAYAHGLAYLNRIEESYKILGKLGKESPDTWLGQLSSFFLYALQNKKTEAMQAVSENLIKAARGDELMPLWMAECYAMIHEKSEAVDWLEEGAKWGFINYPFLNEYDPFLENIRGEPRFKKLMERVKHEWENFEV
ncbi:protein kinase [Acidobacteriota bacterium]